MRTITIKKVFNPDNKLFYWIATIKLEDGSEVPELLRASSLALMMAHVGRTVKDGEAVILKKEV